jgi:pyridoxal phosphate enzyme (YggS family)
MSYQAVLERMERATERAGREIGEVDLVAVSKAKTVEEIRVVYELGHRDFGENRAKEMAEKAPLLPDDIRWHYVGALQSNKARMVRPITHLLHSMDRESLASAWAKGHGNPPPVLIQVNTGGEPQKSGVLPDETGTMVGRVLNLGLEVLGLMAIPPVAGPEETRRHFRLLADLGRSIQAKHPEVRELSMGMTDDFEIAIEEGASLIRVGRAIFGARN